MIVAHKIYTDILTPDEYSYLWSFLQQIPYTFITGANMKCAKAFQSDNRGNAQASNIISFLQSTAIANYLSFNDFVVIKYDSGSSYVGWHTDGGYYMQPGCEIGSLSMGVEREIQFRRIGGDEVESAFLFSNSLLIMPSGFQETYEHRIPESRMDGVRFGLVLYTRR